MKCGLFRILFTSVLPIVEVQVELVPVAPAPAPAPADGGGAAPRVLVDVVVARGGPPDVAVGRHLVLLVLLLVLLLEALLLLLPEPAPRGRFRFRHEPALSVAVVPFIIKRVEITNKTFQNVIKMCRICFLSFFCGLKLVIHAPFERNLRGRLQTET